MLDIFEFGVHICDLLMNDHEVQDWIERGVGAWDLIVLDSFLNDCALGMVHKYQVPHIVFGTSSPYNWVYDELGMPAETSWIPDVHSDFPEDMGLAHRIRNTFQTIFWHLYKQWYFVPRIEAAIKKGLNIEDLPPLGEIMRNVSVVFTNTHYGEEYARSLPPLVVPVAGMLCYKEPKPLPKVGFFEQAS
jgi:glucuronosyltransferase